MSKEPTINASFGNMPETGGFHKHRQMGNGWTKDKMGHLVPKFMEKYSAPEDFLELIVCRCKEEMQRAMFLLVSWTSARALALVKINAAASKKMTKKRNINPLYQFELSCHSRVQ